MIWISQATGWHVPEVPAIAFMTPTQLARTAYECDKPTIDNEAICSLSDEEIKLNPGVMRPIALYNTETELVMMPAEFNVDKIRDRSILLHELVHYMQWKNGIYPKQYPCRQATEAEAYNLQEKYLLEEGGVELHDVIEIGPLLRFMLTTCQDMGWGR